MLLLLYGRVIEKVVPSPVKNIVLTVLFGPEEEIDYSTTTGS